MEQWRICLGSDNLVYYPNTEGDPAGSDPASKIDDTDWFGGFASVAEAIMHMESLFINQVFDDKAPALGGALNCNGKTINLSSARQIAQASPADATIHTFNYANGDMQKIVCPAGGTLTLDFIGFPSNAVSGFIISLVNAGNCSVINHPAGMMFARGTAPEYTVAGTDRLLVTKDADGVLVLSEIAMDYGLEA